MLRTPRSQFRSQPTRKTGRETDRLANGTKSGVIVTQNNVVDHRKAPNRAPPRYLRSMNANEVELLIAVLSLLLAGVSVYFAATRIDWGAFGSP